MPTDPPTTTRRPHRRTIAGAALLASAALVATLTPGAASATEPTPTTTRVAEVHQYHPPDSDLSPPAAPEPEIRVDEAPSDALVAPASVDPHGIDLHPALHRGVTLGEDRVAVWLCTVPTNSTERFYSQIRERVVRTPAGIAAWANQRVNPWVREVSGSRMTTTFVAAGTIALTTTEGPASCLDRALASTGRPYSNVLAVDTTPYGGGFAGPGFIGWSSASSTLRGSTLASAPLDTHRGMWVGGGATGGDAGVVIHELGHTLHWPHSHAGEDEYGNNVDVMSRVIGNGQNTLAVHRYVAGWLDPSQVQVFAGNTLRADLARPGAAGTALIAVRSNDSRVFTTIEARPRTGRDGALPVGGVAVHVVDQRPCRPFSDSGFTSCPSLYRHIDAVNGVAYGNNHVVAPGGRLTTAGVHIDVVGSTATGYDVRVTPVVPRLVDPFSDVRVEDYFADGVRWMVRNHITQGFPTPTRFSPSLQVSRSQLALMLHRVAGKPAPSVANRFTDVANTANYATAVRWLDEQGITEGVGGTNRFAPTATVTRSELALMLHRMAGSPSARSRHPYQDVRTTGQLAGAVSWMHAEGITTGTGTPPRFNPSGGVTRGQLAAFLHRMAT